jgi:copper transport protein
MYRTLSMLALALVAVVLTAGPAFAHVELAASDPETGTVVTEPVDAITLEFSVESVIAGDGVVLYGEDGVPIEAEVVQVSDTVVVVTPAAPLSDGRHAVTWSMQSGDAHPVTGGIEFSIAVPAATPATGGTDSGATGAAPVPIPATASQTEGTSLLDAVLEEPGSPLGGLVSTLGRAASITATLIGLGALAFGALVLRGSRREAEAVGYWMRRSGAVIVAAAPILLVGRILETGVDGIGAIAFETLLQLAGGIALLGGTRIVTVPEPDTEPGSGATLTQTRQRFRVDSSPAALVGMAALVLAFALDGHSGALAPRWLMTAASMVHVIAAAIWVGGVALIGSTLLGRASRDEPLDAGKLVIPFSIIAGAAVAGVGIAGTAMALVIADGLGTLFTTPWGWAMLSKLGFVAVAGAIGAYNHFVLVPLFRTDAGHRGATAHIVRAVRVEIVCLVIAATITGALVGLSAS